MQFRICLLSIICCLWATVPVDAGRNSNATIALDYVASGQSNRIDNGVVTGRVSGRGSTIVVEVFAKNVSTSLAAIEIHFKPSTVLDFVRAEHPRASLPLHLENGVAMTFVNSRLAPSTSGVVFLAKAEFTTIVEVHNIEFKIEIERVKLVENASNLDDITSSNAIVFNRSSTTNDSTAVGSDTHVLCWKVEPLPGDLNFDGRVNILDFRLFSDNYGRTGPVPIRAEGVSIVTIRDTIRQMRTVRDTIYLQGGGTDTIYVGQTVGAGLARISISAGRMNWDGSDPDDDGIQVTVSFRNKNEKPLFAPEIRKVEVTLGKDNDRDDRPDVPFLLDRVVAVFSETDRTTTPYWRLSRQYSAWDDLKIRIPDEIYRHKLDIRTDYRGDSQYGVVDVYVTTTSGTFSDRDAILTMLWKPVVPSEE